MIDFFQRPCQSQSRQRKFGLCDDPTPPGAPGTPAYINETNGKNWIATVDNHYRDLIKFYAIDHCVDFPPDADGRTSKRCDGVLVQEEIIAFVELKSRNENRAVWVKDAEKQLLVTIRHFEETVHSDQFSVKKAYVVNSMRPHSRVSQATRMESFFDETGYVLYIKARIALYSPEG